MQETLELPATRSAVATPAPATAGAMAALLLGRVGAGETLFHIAETGRAAERLAGLLAAMAPGAEVILLPPWDCLPFDRVSPSRAVMGRRMAALRRLAAPADRPRLVVATPEALVQRLPPRSAVAAAKIELRPGAELDLETVSAALLRLGYIEDERVDEAGEVALRGRVVDLFPAEASHPVRIEHEEGRIAEIRRYDPVTQRSDEIIEHCIVGPASEAVLEAGEAAADREPGAEHRLGAVYSDGLDTIADYLGDAMLVLEPGVERRVEVLLDQLEDGAASGGEVRVSGLYLDRRAVGDLVERLRPLRLASPSKAEAAAGQVPRFATERSPGRALAAYVGERIEAGHRIVLAGESEAALRELTRRARRALGREVAAVPDWQAVLAAAPGTLVALRLPAEAGFLLSDAGVTVIAAADFLGSRTVAAGSVAAQVLPIGEIELRLGDAVVHLDHGMGLLDGIEVLNTPDGGSVDAVRLRYAADATLIVPADEISRIWRYGGEADAVTLDRLDGDAWEKRRQKVEAEIAEVAAELVALAEARRKTRAPKLEPSQREYERFVQRFRYMPSPDQQAAIDAVLADLGSGRPMDRLVCGDVGFGKTEVALRAAAAAAFAGKQVAVVAPTTVLVRQHLQTFRRRFAGLGIEVGHLSRLVKPAEARETKQRLADGSLRVVIGTHALAGKGVRFADLGLVVIDEEQRFGARDKEKLRALASKGHVLTLTATPIPRTLQSAIVGLQDLSVIATPPVLRQPIRTVLAPFDPVMVREALLRERRRGGQSFFVVPRIEDMAPIRARLGEIVPELEIKAAHGKMPADEIDQAMVSFADGEGDVLLATNIIESGLDLPRANTMLIWRADRFGLAQLHQLRGRAGRSSRRGVAYLLTDPDKALPAATEKRLRTLEAMDRLGAGFAISARDLDLRGAGDLLGEEQVGHVRLIGLTLYQHLLERALAAARGEAVEEDWSPELNIGEAGRIEEAYVPEPEVRINLHARLAAPISPEQIEALEDEVEDRFGPIPEATMRLFARARLRSLCRELGVARLDAGPQAIALTFRPGALRRAGFGRAIEAAGEDLRWSGDRLIQPRATETLAEREAAATNLLERLARE